MNSNEEREGEEEREMRELFNDMGNGEEETWRRDGETYLVKMVSGKINCMILDAQIKACITKKSSVILQPLTTLSLRAPS